MAQPVIFNLGFDDSQAISTINRVASHAERRFNNLRINGRPFKEIGNEAQKFDRTLSQVSDRFIAFAAATQLVYGLSNAFKALFNNAVKVEDALAQIQVNMKTSAQQMTKLSSGLFRVASETGQSFYEAADAAAEFGRQGLGLNKVLEATKAALVLTQTTGLAVEDSVRGLTVAVNTFQREGLSYADVVNKMAEADTNFAVSSKDLVEFISRVGSAATDANISFEQTLAVATSLKQITGRTGSVLGNSFKSIITRLQRGRTRDVLEDVGVSTTNIDGSFKNQITVLRNLANTYETLSDAQKAFVSEQVGGVFQINAVKALFSDIGKEAGYYANVLKIVGQDSEAAFGKSEFLANTASGSINKLKNSFIELGGEIGKLGLNDSIKYISSEITGLTNILNSSLKDDGDGTGFQFGQSFVKGIVSAVTGPGLALALASFVKLSGRIGKRFATDIRGQFLNRGVNETRARAMEQIRSNMLQQEAIKNEAAMVGQLQKGNALLQQRVGLMQAAGLSGGGAAGAGSNYKRPKGKLSSFNTRQLVAEAKHGSDIGKKGAMKELNKRGVLSNPNAALQGVPLSMMHGSALRGVAGDRNRFGGSMVRGAARELESRSKKGLAEQKIQKQQREYDRLERNSKMQAYIAENPRAKSADVKFKGKQLGISSKDLKGFQAETRRNRRAGHMTKAGGGLMLAGFVGSMVGDAIGGSAGNFVSSTTQGMGTGAMLGSMAGPVGMAAGAVIGGFYGVAEAVKDSTLGLRDFEETARNSAAAMEKQNAAFSLFEQGSLQLETVLSNPNSTPSQVRAANEKRASALGDASPELRAILQNKDLSGQERRTQASNLLLKENKKSNLLTSLGGVMTNADQNTSALQTMFYNVIGGGKKFNVEGERPFKSLASSLTAMVDINALRTADKHSKMGQLRSSFSGGSFKETLDGFSQAGILGQDEFNEVRDFTRSLSAEQQRQLNDELRDSLRIRKLISREEQIENKLAEESLNLQNRLREAVDASSRQGGLRSSLLASNSKVLGADFDMMSSQPGLSSSAGQIFASLSKTAGGSSDLFKVQQESSQSLNNLFEDFFEKIDDPTRKSLDPNFQADFLKRSADPTKIEENIDKFVETLNGLPTADRSLVSNLRDLRADYQKQTSDVKQQIDLERRQLEILMRIERNSRFNNMVQSALDPGNAVKTGIRNIQFNKARDSFFNPDEDERTRRRNILRDNGSRGGSSRQATRNLEQYRSQRAGQARNLLTLDAERRANGESGLSEDRLAALQTMVLGESRASSFRTELGLTSFEDGGLSRMMMGVRHSMALGGGSIDTVKSARDSIRSARLNGRYSDEDTLALSSLEDNLQGSLNKTRAGSTDSVDLLMGLRDFRNTSKNSSSANKFVSAMASAVDRGDAVGANKLYEDYASTAGSNKEFKNLAPLLKNFSELSSSEEGQMSKFNAQRRQGVLDDLASQPSPLIGSQDKLKGSIDELNKTIQQHTVNAGLGVAGTAIQNSKLSLTKQRNKLESEIDRDGHLLSDDDKSFRNHHTKGSIAFMDELTWASKEKDLWNKNPINATQNDQFNRLRYTLKTGAHSGFSKEEFMAAIESFEKYTQSARNNISMQKAIDGSVGDFDQKSAGFARTARIAAQQIYGGEQNEAALQKMDKILERLEEVAELEKNFAKTANEINVRIDGADSEEIGKLKAGIEKLIRDTILKSQNEPDLFNAG